VPKSKPTSATKKSPRKRPSPKSVTPLLSAPAEAEPPFSIVGIGASAGGLHAIRSLFTTMPAESGHGLSFVIVQHLAPDHISILTQLVQRFTALSVMEAKDGTQVKPNCVYIIPPNRDLGILSGKLQLFERDTPHRASHPIDFFFRALAADQGERAISIILSGTGSDGTLGLRAIKSEGGMAIAQSPESAEFDGMPRSAVASGLVDYVLTPDEMPAQLLAYVSSRNHAVLVRKHPEAPQASDIIAKMCILIRAKTGHDFSQYKESTLVRRAERRMAIHQIEDHGDYLRFLQQNSAEVNALFRDLLIGVTSFFRDRDAFDALEAIAIPQLFQNSPPDSIIRVWVCGCSTGEEAYSVAILIQEYLEKNQDSRSIQIFATDLDRQSTDKARAGVFPASIAADVSADRLARFFSLENDGSYRIGKAIRTHLIFSEQDVLKDPPFSRLNLITCRNLLIYVNAEVQKRLIPLFHFVLQPGGLLFLGTAENVGDHPLLFDTLDRKAKIYRRINERNTDALAGALPLKVRADFLRKAPNPPQTNLRELTEQSLLNYLARAAVLVTARGEILYYYGRTGNYLEPASGIASSGNILSMAREGLRRDLTSALHSVASRHEPVQVNGLQIKSNGLHIAVNLAIIPASRSAQPSTDLFLVILEERPISEFQVANPVSTAEETLSQPEESAHLRLQLAEKDRYIRTIVQEMESSGEELKSSSEEMQAVSEEMQSANEELQTSREQLQSVNDELAAVNAQLRQKVADLSRANNDMNNLLAGTGVGTIFVDNWLRITRFTPSITEVLPLIETDVGRAFGDIVSNLIGYQRLTEDVETVLNTLVPIEIEVQAKSSSWFLLSIRPYRTLDNEIEGVVITFVDRTKRKLAEQALAEANLFRRAAQVETVGIVFFQPDGGIASANEAFLHMIGYQREDLKAGRLNWSQLTPPDWTARIRRVQDSLQATGRTDPFEAEYLHSDGTRNRALFCLWRLTETEAVAYIIPIPHGIAQIDPRLLVDPMN
jgi:two-component system CheB/CheR fusion protein